MLDKEILVVDDEKDLRVMIRSIFESAGYTQITTAASGEEALALMAKKIPGIIILDVMMPGMEAEVIKNGQRIPLTAKEYSIFQKLADNAGHIVTIGLLCQAVCGEIWQGYETTLMTHIRHLREKIEENPSKPVSLLTMKGLGYKLLVKEPEK